MDANVSYELRPNLYIDLGATHRNYAYENGMLPDNTSTYFYGGVRLNVARRDYNNF